MSRKEEKSQIPSIKSQTIMQNKSNIQTNPTKE